MNKKNEKLPNNPSSVPTTSPRPTRRVISHAQPVLRFNPTAWAKLLFLRDMGNTEIGGFAIAHKNDPLLVQDLVTVKQLVSVASVAFDDNAVADFFDRQIDLGLKPQQFMRIWCHSHPGDSAHPSSTDEETFARVFGNSDWAIMFIVSRSSKTYARLRFNTGPGGHLQVPVHVDYSQPFTASDHEAWKQEYEANIHPEILMPNIDGLGPFERDLPGAPREDWGDRDIGFEHLDAWAAAHGLNEEDEPWL